jgi:hypothetical protein
VLTIGRECRDREKGRQPHYTTLQDSEAAVLPYYSPTAAPIFTVISPVYIITGCLLTDGFVCFELPMMPFGTYPKVPFASIKKMLGPRAITLDKTGSSQTAGIERICRSSSCSLVQVV